MNKITKQNDKSNAVSYSQLTFETEERVVRMTVVPQDEENLHVSFWNKEKSIAGMFAPVIPYNTLIVDRVTFIATIEDFLFDIKNIKS